MNDSVQEVPVENKVNPEASSTSTQGNNFGNATSPAAMDLADAAIDSCVFAMQALTQKVAKDFDKHFNEKVLVDNNFLQHHNESYKTRRHNKEKLDLSEYTKEER